MKNLFSKNLKGVYPFVLYKIFAFTYTRFLEEKKCVLPSPLMLFVCI